MMSFANEFIITSPLVKVLYIIKKGLPSWSITYFLEKVCLNHLKLVSIQRICELKSMGFNDEQLLVVAYSADIIPKNPFSKTSFENIITYSTKDKSPEKFWFIIERYKRPIVLFKYNNELIPLYDFNYPEAARIIHYTEESPSLIVFEGLGSAFWDLMYGPIREKRKEQIHKSDLMNKSIKNIEGIISSYEIINGRNVPEGVKKYAKNALDNILENQINLNIEIGIMDKKINLKI